MRVPRKHKEKENTLNDQRQAADISETGAEVKPIDRHQDH